MKNDKNNIGSRSRDELLGKALSTAVSREKAPGECPTDQDLAALLEGTPGAADQEHMREHIASCNDCLVRFTLAAKLAVPTARAHRHGWYRYAAGTVAVAAAMVAVVLSRQESSIRTAHVAPQVASAPKGPEVAPGRPSPLPRPNESTVTRGEQKQRPAQPASLTATALAKANYDGGSKAQSASAQSTQSYGFSASVVPAWAAFRAGVATMDLGAAIKESDVTARDNAAERLARWVERDADKLRIKQLPGDEPPTAVRQRYLSLVGDLERHAAEGGNAMSFRFGAWAEAGRLADDAMIRDLVEKSAVKTFREGLKGDDLPESARLSLEKLDALLASPTGTAKEKRLIRSILGDIIDSF